MQPQAWIVAPILVLPALASLVDDRPPLPVDRMDSAVLEVVPAGLPQLVPAPLENPHRPGLAALGRALFFDPILSIDRSVSCASCHQPEHGFASPERFPLGARGRRALRHAPALLNRAFGRSFMWDGRVDTLEEQVLQPISNPNEMGLPLEQALARLRVEGDWRARFEAVSPGGVSAESLSFALAGFVRRLFAGDSPVDAFRAGRFSALSAEERGGMWIFESKGGCWRCHAGFNFTDERFHNTGVGSVDGVSEVGRSAVSGRPEDRGAFKTPTLRGLVESAPYMHDGSLASLEEVLEFYRQGGVANDHLDPALRPLELSADERELLLAFLRALSRTVGR